MCLKIITVKECVHMAYKIKMNKGTLLLKKYISLSCAIRFKYVNVLYDFIS